MRPHRAPVEFEGYEHGLTNEEPLCGLLDYHDRSVLKRSIAFPLHEFDAADQSSMMSLKVAADSHREDRLRKSLDEVNSIAHRVHAE